MGWAVRLLDRVGQLLDTVGLILLALNWVLWHTGVFTTLTMFNTPLMAVTACVALCGVTVDAWGRALGPLREPLLHRLLTRVRDARLDRGRGVAYAEVHAEGSLPLLPADQRSLA